jgi:purine-binding chemotaxis protein CheW
VLFPPKETIQGIQMNENIQRQNEANGEIVHTAVSREIQLISFRLGEEEFGVEIEYVKEILKITPMTPIPKAPPYLLGMMNLRGTILPVLDPKSRLKLPSGPGITEKARILVLLISDLLSGLVVDEVSEVQRIDASAIEPPPAVTRGIDKFFLSGVVKLKQKNRLIMMLNLGEVLAVDIARGGKSIPDNIARGDLFDTGEQVKEVIHETQLVTYTLGDEEYGLDIGSVKEILRLDDVTAVPNVPPYVKGILNVRDRVLPIIEMRKIVGMEKLEDFHSHLVEELRNGHLDWAANLKAALYEGTSFTKSTDPTQCRLGKLLDFWKTRGIEFADMYKKFKPPHDALHHSAVDILKLAKTRKDDAIEIYNNKTTIYLDTLMHLFFEMEELLKKHDLRDQRILIVDIAGTTTGLLVDRVTEVSRFPAAGIETTPAVIASYGKEIKGIVKLNNGKRLILFVDENLLIPMEDIEAISKIGEDIEESTAVEEVKERQYVVFTIYGEEFGITIDNVREIFNVDNITPVPKAPVFIKGVTNLRGIIIPVVDTSERFGAAVETSKSQKILVTVIDDTTVGLLVDSVREVLRVSEKEIEDAPSLVLSTVDTAYLEGIAKLDGGQRIILLLNVKEIMTKKDFAKLRQIRDTVEAGIREETETATESEIQLEEKREEKSEEKREKKPGKKRDETKKLPKKIRGK